MYVCKAKNEKKREKKERKKSKKKVVPGVLLCFQGNNNNFLSLEQCRSTCGVPLLKARPLHLVGHTSEASPPRPLLPASPTQPFDISDCLHPPDSGFKPFSSGKGKTFVCTT